MLKLLVLLLLGKRESRFEVIRIRGRNVSIQIEEYVPATELKERYEDRLQARPETIFEKSERIKQLLETGEMTMNQARKEYGLKPIEDPFFDKFLKKA
jgi:hypothetical protein